MNKICSILIFFLLFAPIQAKDLNLTTITFVDRNGVSETISSKNRLKAFQKQNFRQPQPYEQVNRTYERDQQGNHHSRITTYHPNGQLKEYLECKNHRALGHYQEFYPNGQLKVQSFIIGGIPDLSEKAKATWIFNGLCKAFDENGSISAEIYYDKGAFEGPATYYHSNGVLWKKLNYTNNLLQGQQETYLKDGSCLEVYQTDQGKKDGIAIRYWHPNQIAHHEIYQKGELIKASYYDSCGNQKCGIENGTGIKAILGKSTIQEYQEYQNGKQQGLVEYLDTKGNITKTTYFKDEKKDGLETYYYTYPNKKLEILWKGDVIQGTIQSYYPNGQLESRKEFFQNQKNGLAHGFYPNGCLMFVEEYQNDRLLKGEYYSKEDSSPISSVKLGHGIATIFDQDGLLLQKVNYQNGYPYP